MEPQVVKAPLRNLQATIDDELHRFLKMVAARDGVTLSELANRVVRLGLEAYESGPRKRGPKSS